MSGHGPVAHDGWAAAADTRGASPVAIAGDLAGRAVDPASARWHWRLTLHACQAGQDVPLDETHRPVRLVALDAALQRGHGQAPGEPLRLQVVTPDPAVTLRAAEATRVVALHARKGVSAELLARPLQGPMLLPGSARWLAWLLAGRAEVQLGDQRWPLEGTTPVWLPHDPARRLRIDGGGELLLVRLEGAAAAN